MKIIIPMAGLGERFVKAGYSDPKPLIKVDGKPQVEHIVNMFPGKDDFTFICNDNHIQNTLLEHELKRLKPSAKIITISAHKLGPVWTLLEALKKEDYLTNEPVIVSYCDFRVWWDYEHFKKTVAENKCDAAAISYIGFHPHLIGPQLYASMRVDENNWMLECKEKFSFTENKMESHQQAGLFYFANGLVLKKYLEETVKRNLIVNNEYYVSMLTEAMNQDGLKVHVYPVQHFLQWGTPQDMQTYQFWSDYFAAKGGK